MSRIRVIAGSARGRRLHMVPGDATRPIMDRVKEALFNIIQQDLPGSNFMDLFAGTGSVGIEALSRGAKLVWFVDRDKVAVSTIQKNLALTQLENGAKVFNQDSFQVIGRPPSESFDYIFIAPPQYHGLWIKALQTIDNYPDWLVEDGWVIVQIDPKEFKPVELRNFLEFDRRKYGNSLLVFYERGALEHE